VDGGAELCDSTELQLRACTMGHFTATWAAFVEPESASDSDEDPSDYEDDMGRFATL
jgi:hypothetical protein